MSTDEQYRAGFEAACLAAGYPISRYSTGEYVASVRHRFEGWIMAQQLKREASTEPSALTDDEILDATMMVEPEPFGLSESGPEYMGYDLAIGRAVEAMVAARFRAAGRNTCDESTANTDEVGAGALPDEATPQVGRAALDEFCAKYCHHKPDLVSCAESAFYWFNKVLAGKA